MVASTTTVQSVFQDAVRSTSTHRKNVAALLKLLKRLGPSDFLASLEDCVLRILAFGKGVAEADRAVTFVGAFLGACRGLDDSGAALARVASMLLPLSLRGLSAALKAVRFRSCQILASLLNTVDEITEAQYLRVKSLVLERVRDKESAVRASAAAVLCRLHDSADEADAAQIRVQLLSLLSHDTSADVRKAVLWNLSLTLETAEALVERARDIDPAVRKLVFAKLTLEQEAADLLSIDLRRQLLKTGLDDRDANVRAACIKLLSSGWIKQAGGINGFVESLDVRGSYEAASAIVLSLFRHNPSLRFESRDFQWQSLTCEAAFLAHHFAVHLKSANDDAGFDLLVPSLSDLVGIMQGYMSQIVSEEDETSRLELEFVIQELIALCINLDLCDETGRRLLSEFLDSALVEMDLPPAGIAHVVRLGLQLSDGTSEYVSKLVLLLGRIRESYGLEPEPEPMGSEQPQDRNWSETEAVAMLKCLDTVHGVVQLLDFTYSEHGLMYELLEKYVFPCTGSSILAISKLALSCLAQCSLLDKTLAAANLDIFLAYLESHDERALGSFQYFVDAIMHYGKDALAEKQSQVQAAMRTFLKSNNSERLSVAVEGFCKLLLLQRITDTQDLLAMVILFYHPSTSQIQKLRQSLSYFLPAFGHLLPAELAKIFVPAILALSSLPRAEATGMLPPLAVASQIVDWIAAAKPDTDASDTTFTDLVEECLKSAIHGQPMNRRFLCQVLPKLPLPGSLSAEQIAHIDSLTQQLQSLVTDTQSTLALKRFRKPLDAETGDAAQLKTVTDSVADLSLA